MQRLYRNGKSGTLVSLRKNVGYLFLVTGSKCLRFLGENVFFINMNILSNLLHTFTKVVQFYHSTPGYWVKWASGNMNIKVKENSFIFPSYVSLINQSLRFGLKQFAKFFICYLLLIFIL